MNKHRQEYLASLRRIEEARQVIIRRKERAAESYRCYLVYTRMRKLL
jgi:hypothetical protein